MAAAHWSPASLLKKNGTYISRQAQGLCRRERNHLPWHSPRTFVPEYHVGIKLRLT